MIKKLTRAALLWDGNLFSRIHKGDVVIVIEDITPCGRIKVLTKVGIGYVLHHVFNTD